MKQKFQKDEREVKTMNDLFSNIVDEENLKQVQLEVLKKLSDTLSKTAGPYGADTIILGDPGMGKPDIYTKDGHKTLCHIDFFNPLEKSIQSQLKEVTEHIANTVGDGTTSTVMMCYSIFNSLYDYFLNHKSLPKFKVVKELTYCIDTIKEEIRKNGRDITLGDIYKICMISTNGNESLSRDITGIYQEVGTSVYINVSTTSLHSENVTKTYNGMTLEKGYTTEAYVNTSDAKVIIPNPRIYSFVDPIDTPEMIDFMSNIIYNNILKPYNDRNFKDMIPTVILAPHISRDGTALLEELEKLLYQCPVNAKPPVLIIPGLNKFTDQYHDIFNLCGTKTIKKYIDPKVQNRDIEDGKAPNMTTIVDWYGTCERIEADNHKTMFINPSLMYNTNEDGELVYSDMYNGMVHFLETELDLAIKNDEGVMTIGTLRRRLNSLQNNLVDFFIGGISSIDRESIKDLAEDAVLNCRSACINGVGYGSNFEGYRATLKLYNEEENSLRKDIYKIILNAYDDVIKNLYKLNFNGNAEDLMEQNIKQGKPINLRTLTYDDKDDVLCSIDCDITILDAIKKVIIPMATSNQCLLLNVQHNKYLK